MFGNVQKVVQQLRRMISKCKIKRNKFKGNDDNALQGKKPMNFEMVSVANENIDIDNSKDIAKIKITYDMLMKKFVNPRLDLLSPYNYEFEKITMLKHKKRQQIAENLLQKYIKMSSNHKRPVTENKISHGWFGQKIHQHSLYPKVETSSNSNEISNGFYKFPENDDNAVNCKKVTSNSFNNTSQTSENIKEENKLCSSLSLDNSMHIIEVEQNNQLNTNEDQFINESDKKPKMKNEDTSKNHNEVQFHRSKAPHRESNDSRTKQDLENKPISNNNTKETNEIVRIKETKEDISTSQDSKEPIYSDSLFHENSSDSKRLNSLEKNNSLLAPNIIPNFEAEKTCSLAGKNESSNNCSAETTAACSIENKYQPPTEDNISRTNSPLGTVVNPQKGNLSNENCHENGHNRSVTTEEALPRESEQKHTSQSSITESTCLLQSNCEESAQNNLNLKNVTFKLPDSKTNALSIQIKTEGVSNLENVINKPNGLHLHVTNPEYISSDSECKDNSNKTQSQQIIVDNNSLKPNNENDHVMKSAELNSTPENINRHSESKNYVDHIENNFNSEIITYNNRETRGKTKQKVDYGSMEDLTTQDIKSPEVNLSQTDISKLLVKFLQNLQLPSTHMQPVKNKMKVNTTPNIEIQDSKGNIKIKTNNIVVEIKNDCKRNKNSKSKAPKLTIVATPGKTKKRGTHPKNKVNFSRKGEKTFGKTTKLSNKHICNMLTDKNVPINANINFQISVPGLNNDKNNERTMRLSKPLVSNRNPSLKNKTSGNPTGNNSKQIDTIGGTKTNTTFNLANCDYHTEPVSSKQYKPIPVTKLQNNKSIENVSQNILCKTGSTKIRENNRISSPLKAAVTRCEGPPSKTTVRESHSQVRNIKTNKNKNKLPTQNLFYSYSVEMTPETRKLHSKKPETKGLTLKMYGTGTITKVSSMPAINSSKSKKQIKTDKSKIVPWTSSGSFQINCDRLPTKMQARKLSTIEQKSNEIQVSSQATCNKEVDTTPRSEDVKECLEKSKYTENLINPKTCHVNNEDNDAMNSTHNVSQISDGNNMESQQSASNDKFCERKTIKNPSGNSTKWKSKFERLRRHILLRNKKKQLNTKLKTRLSTNLNKCDNKGETRQQSNTEKDTVNNNIIKKSSSLVKETNNSMGQTPDLNKEISLPLHNTLPKNNLSLSTSKMNKYCLQNNKKSESEETNNKCSKIVSKGNVQPKKGNDLVNLKTDFNSTSMKINKCSNSLPNSKVLKNNVLKTAEDQNNLLTEPTQKNQKCKSNSGKKSNNNVLYVKSVKFALRNGFYNTTSHSSCKRWNNFANKSKIINSPNNSGIKSEQYKHFKGSELISKEQTHTTHNTNSPIQSNSRGKAERPLNTQKAGTHFGEGTFETKKFDGASNSYIQLKNHNQVKTHNIPESTDVKNKLAGQEDKKKAVHTDKTKHENISLKPMAKNSSHEFSSNMKPQKSQSIERLNQAQFLGKKSGVQQMTSVASLNKKSLKISRNQNENSPSNKILIKKQTDHQHSLSTLKNILSPLYDTHTIKANRTGSEVLGNKSLTAREGAVLKTNANTIQNKMYLGKQILPENTTLNYNKNNIQQNKKQNTKSAYGTKLVNKAKSKEDISSHLVARNCLPLRPNTVHIHNCLTSNPDKTVKLKRTRIVHRNPSDQKSLAVQPNNFDEQLERWQEKETGLDAKYNNTENRKGLLKQIKHNAISEKVQQHGGTCLNVGQYSGSAENVIQHSSKQNKNNICMVNLLNDILSETSKIKSYKSKNNIKEIKHDVVKRIPTPKRSKFSENGIQTNTNDHKLQSSQYENKSKLNDQLIESKIKQILPTQRILGHPQINKHSVKKDVDKILNPLGNAKHEISLSKKLLGGIPQIRFNAQYTKPNQPDLTIRSYGHQRLNLDKNSIKKESEHELKSVSNHEENVLKEGYSQKQGGSDSVHDFKGLGTVQEKKDNSTSTNYTNSKIILKTAEKAATTQPSLSTNLPVGVPQMYFSVQYPKPNQLDPTLRSYGHQRIKFNDKSITKVSENELKSVENHEENGLKGVYKQKLGVRDSVLNFKEIILEKNNSTSNDTNSKIMLKTPEKTLSKDLSIGKPQINISVQYPKPSHQPDITLRSYGNQHTKLDKKPIKKDSENELKSVGNHEGTVFKKGCKQKQVGSDSVQNFKELNKEKNNNSTSTNDTNSKTKLKTPEKTTQPPSFQSHEHSKTLKSCNVTEKINESQPTNHLQKMESAIKKSSDIMSEYNNQVNLQTGQSTKKKTDTVHGFKPKKTISEENNFTKPLASKLVEESVQKQNLATNVNTSFNIENSNLNNSELLNTTTTTNVPLQIVDDEKNIKYESIATPCARNTNSNKFSFNCTRQHSNSTSHVHIGQQTKQNGDSINSNEILKEINYGNKSTLKPSLAPHLEPNIKSMSDSEASSNKTNALNNLAASKSIKINEHLRSNNNIIQRKLNKNRLKNDIIRQNKVLDRTLTLTGSDSVILKRDIDSMNKVGEQKINIIKQKHDKSTNNSSSLTCMKSSIDNLSKIESILMQNKNNINKIPNIQNVNQNPTKEKHIEIKATKCNLTLAKQLEKASQQLLHHTTNKNCKTITEVINSNDSPTQKNSVNKQSKGLVLGKNTSVVLGNQIIQLKKQDETLLSHPIERENHFPTCPLTLSVEKLQPFVNHKLLKSTEHNQHQILK